MNLLDRIYSFRTSLAAVLSMQIAMSPVVANAANSNAIQGINGASFVQFNDGDDEIAPIDFISPPLSADGKQTLQVNHMLPVYQREFSVEDYRSHQPESVTLTYIYTHDKEQFYTAQAYINKLNTSEPAETVATTMFASREEANPVSALTAEDLGVKPGALSQLGYVAEMWQQGLETVRNFLNSIEQKHQTRQFTKAIENEEKARANEAAKTDALEAKQAAQKVKDAAKLQARIERNSRPPTLGDRALKWFMSTNISKTSPWKFRSADRKLPTTFYEATFTTLRVASIYGVMRYSFVSDMHIIYPYLQSVLAAAEMATGSGLIMINGNAYNDMFIRHGKTTARLKWIVKKWAMLKGQTETEANDTADAFEKTALHTILNQSVKFTATEIPFLSIPILTFTIGAGLAAFPGAYDWATTMFNGSDPNSIWSALWFATLATTYGIGKLGSSVAKALWTQGTIDPANAMLMNERKHEVDNLVLNDKLSPEQGAREKREIEFKTNLKVLGVSLLSNGGVVIGMMGKKELGDAVIYSMGTFGTLFYAHTTYKYNESFRNFVNNLVKFDGLRASWDMFKTQVLATAAIAAPDTENSCIDLLSRH